MQTLRFLSFLYEIYKTTPLYKTISCHIKNGRNGLEAPETIRQVIWYSFNFLVLSEVFDDWLNSPNYNRWPGRLANSENTTTYFSPFLFKFRKVPAIIFLLWRCLSMFSTFKRLRELETSSLSPRQTTPVQAVPPRGPLAFFKLCAAFPFRRFST